MKLVQISTIRNDSQNHGIALNNGLGIVRTTYPEAVFESNIDHHKLLVDVNDGTLVLDGDLTFDTLLVHTVSEKLEFTKRIVRDILDELRMMPTADGPNIYLVVHSHSNIHEVVLVAKYDHITKSYNFTA